MQEEAKWVSIFDKLNDELLIRYRSLVKYWVGTMWQEKLYNNLETWDDLEKATSMMAHPAREAVRISIQEVRGTLKSLKYKMLAESSKILADTTTS